MAWADRDNASMTRVMAPAVTGGAQHEQETPGDPGVERSMYRKGAISQKCVGSYEQVCFEHVLADVTRSDVSGWPIAVAFYTLWGQSGLSYLDRELFKFGMALQVVAGAKPEDFYSVVVRVKCWGNPGSAIGRASRDPSLTNWQMISSRCRKFFALVETSSRNLGRKSFTAVDEHFSADCRTSCNPLLVSRSKFIAFPVSRSPFLFQASQRPASTSGWPVTLCVCWQARIIPRVVVARLFRLPSPGLLVLCGSTQSLLSPTMHQSDRSSRRG
jgi:hypothetical protein